MCMCWYHHCCGRLLSWLAIVLLLLRLPLLLFTSAMSHVCLLVSQELCRRFVGDSTVHLGAAVTTRSWCRCCSTWWACGFRTPLSMLQPLQQLRRAMIVIKCIHIIGRLQPAPVCMHRGSTDPRGCAADAVSCGCCGDWCVHVLSLFLHALRMPCIHGIANHIHVADLPVLGLVGSPCCVGACGVALAVARLRPHVVRRLLVLRPSLLLPWHRVLVWP